MQMQIKIIHLQVAGIIIKTSNMHKNESMSELMVIIGLNREQI